MFHVFHLFPMLKSRQYAIERMANFLSREDPSSAHLPLEDSESDQSSSTCLDPPITFEFIKISAEQADPSLQKVFL
jgi:hypothetical protein